jgi:chromosomal replication initiator protein
LVLQLAAPAAAARTQLLRQAAAAMGQRLPDDAAARLVDCRHGTASDLLAALLEWMTRCATSEGAGPTDADVISSLVDRRTSLHQIIAVVARYYQLPQKRLKSASRQQSAVLARATVVYLARELADASYDEIGRALGGRDHSTIIHNFRTIDRRRQRDWQIQETLDELRRILISR